MSERDLLIERLERKLAEKEKELMELRRVSSYKEDLENLKEEIVSQIKAEILTNESINQKISELESKIVELRKAVESIISEVVYIKGEIKSLIERDKLEIKQTRKDLYSDEATNLPEIESIEIESMKDEEKDLTDTEKPKRVKNKDGDIIICD